MTNGEKFKEIFPNIIKYGNILIDDTGALQKNILFDDTWWNAEYKEPTTKNNLGVDAISRQALLNATVKKSSIWNHITNSEGDNLEAIVSKLPSVTTRTRWIPVSEKLPNDRDWYLGIFREPDTGWINPLPFICDYVGRETKATTKEYWILRGLTDGDEHIDYYGNLSFSVVD